MAAIGFGALITAGVAAAPPAKADPSDESMRYAIDHEARICTDIAVTPTVSGFLTILSNIETYGHLSAYDAGSAASLAIFDGCPEYTPVLRRFVAIYGGAGHTA